MEFGQENFYWSCLFKNTEPHTQQKYVKTAPNPILCESIINLLVSCVSFHTYVIVFISRLSTPCIHTLHMFVCYVVPGIRLRSHCELSCLVLTIILWDNLIAIISISQTGKVRLRQVHSFPQDHTAFVSSWEGCHSNIHQSSLMFGSSKCLSNAHLAIQNHRYLEWVDKSVSYIICLHSFSE